MKTIKASVVAIATLVLTAGTAMACQTPGCDYFAGGNVRVDSYAYADAKQSMAGTAGLVGIDLNYRGVVNIQGQSAWNGLSEGTGKQTVHGGGGFDWGIKFEGEKPCFGKCPE